MDGRGEVLKSETYYKGVKDFEGKIVRDFEKVYEILTRETDGTLTSHEKFYYRDPDNGIMADDLTIELNDALKKVVKL